MQELAHSTLTSGQISTAVISPDGVYGYFGGETGIVTQVRLATLEQVRTLSTGTDALLIHTATIAPDGAYAYFGTNNQQVVKVRLADLTVAATATLPDRGAYVAGSTGTTPWAPRLRVSSRYVWTT